MASVVPIYKQNHKQNIQNYRHVSLLPIFRKIFEWLICNELYPFFIKNDSISPNKSGLKQGDSYINQFLSITHDLFLFLDQGFEVSGMFLDICQGLA